METITQTTVKASELRHGNLVYQDGAIEKVVGIVDNKITIQGTIRYTAKEEAYEPIPLTPELLEKCGFENLTLKLTGDTNLEINPDGDEYDVFIRQQDENNYLQQDFVFLTKASFKYLHQLQNLYFALTGSELEINL
jgi:hypothetical protein